MYNKAKIDKAMDSAIERLTKAKAAKPSGYETEIEINGHGVPAIIDYEYIRGCKSGTGDYGMKTEPDEQPYIDMGEIWIFDGQWNIVDIPESCMTEILAEILEHHV